MTIGTRFVLAAAFLCLGSTRAEGGLRVEESNTVESEQSRRKAITYSKRSTIVPDPDALPVDEEKAKELAATYGRWHFWDGEEDMRPEDADMCNGYPSCDIPGEDFEEEVRVLSDCWLLGSYIFVFLTNQSINRFNSGSNGKRMRYLSTTS